VGDVDLKYTKEEETLFDKLLFRNHWDN